MPIGGSRVLPLALLMFLQEALVLLATSTAEGLFLKRVGSQALPGVYVLASFAAVVTSMLYGEVRARLGNRKLSLATIAGFACAAVAVRGPLESGSKWAFFSYFTLVCVFVMIARIQVWSVINRRFTTREAKRVFPLVTGAGLGGSILGGILLQLFPVSWGPSQYQQVTAILAGFYLAAFALATRVRLGAPPEPVADSERVRGLVAEVSAVAGSGYVRAIGLVVMAQMAVLTLVDYHFNRVCDAHYPDESSLIGFFGMFRSVTNMGAFLSQMFVTHRVLMGLGVGASLLVTPLAAIGTSTGLLLAYGFYAGVAAKMVGRFLYRTLHASLYQVLFNAVGDERRETAMLLCDGVAYSLGTVVASGLLWGASALGPDALNFSCLVVACGFLAASLRLRREYLGVLVGHFKGAAGALTVGAAESLVTGPLARLPRGEAVEVRKASMAALARLKTGSALPLLLEGLTDSEAEVRIEAVRGLAGIGDTSVLPELLARLEAEPDDRVRSQLLRAFGRFRGSRVMEGLLGFLHDKVPRIRADLVEMLGTAGEARHAELVEPALEDAEVRVRANAVLALWRRGDERQVRRALEALKAMLVSRESSWRAAAAYVLGRIGNRMAGLLLLDLLEREHDPRVLRNVAASLARTGGEELADPMLVAFARAAAEDRPVWVTALKRVARDSGPFVRAACTARGAVRILAIEMLGYGAKDDVLETLLELSRSEDMEVRISALRSVTRFTDTRVETRLAELLRSEANERVRATALRRLSGHQARRLFPEMVRGVASGTDRERANTLEALTTLAARMPRAQRELFVSSAASVLEHPSGRLAANAAFALWKAGDERGAAALERMLEGERAASALHAIERTGNGRFAPAVAKLLAAAEGPLRTRAALVLERLGTDWSDVLAGLGAAGDEQSRDLLVVYASGGEKVQRYLRRAMGEGRQRIAEGLRDPDVAVRLQVLQVMQILGEEIDRPEALALLDEPEERTRGAAATILARRTWSEPPEPWLRYWSAEMQRVQRYVWASVATRRLATVRTASLMGLSEVVARRARRVAAALVASFDALDAGKNFGPISRNLDEADPIARARALEALESLAPKDLARPLLAVLEMEPSGWEPDSGAGAAGSAPPLDRLFGLVRDEDAEVRRAAGEVLFDVSERYMGELLAREDAPEIAARARALASALARVRRPAVVPPAPDRMKDEAA